MSMSLKTSSLNTSCLSWRFSIIQPKPRTTHKIKIVHRSHGLSSSILSNPGQTTGSTPPSIRTTAAKSGMESLYGNSGNAYVATRYATVKTKAMKTNEIAQRRKLRVRGETSARSQTATRFFFPAFGIKPITRNYTPRSRCGRSAYATACGNQYADCVGFIYGGAEADDYRCVSFPQR